MNSDVARQTLRVSVQPMYTQRTRCRKAARRQLKVCRRYCSKLINVQETHVLCVLILLAFLLKVTLANDTQGGAGNTLQPPNEPRISITRDTFYKPQQKGVYFVEITCNYTEPYRGSCSQVQVQWIYFTESDDNPHMLDTANNASHLTQHAVPIKASPPCTEHLRVEMDVSPHISTEPNSYACRAVSKDGSTLWSSTVQPIPRLTPIPNNVTLVAAIGSKVEARCPSLNALPPGASAAIWKPPDASMTHKNLQYKFPLHQLRISRFTKTNFGTYMCRLMGNATLSVSFAKADSMLTIIPMSVPFAPVDCQMNYTSCESAFVTCRKHDNIAAPVTSVLMTCNESVRKITSVITKDATVSTIVLKSITADELSCAVRYKNSAGVGNSITLVVSITQCFKREKTTSNYPATLQDYTAVPHRNNKKLIVIAFPSLMLLNSVCALSGIIYLCYLKRCSTHQTANTTALKIVRPQTDSDELNQNYPIYETLRDRSENETLPEELEMERSLGHRIERSMEQLIDTPENGKQTRAVLRMEEADQAQSTQSDTPVQASPDSAADESNGRMNVQKPEQQSYALLTVIHRELTTISGTLKKVKKTQDELVDMNDDRTNTSANVSQASETDV